MSHSGCPQTLSSSGSPGPSCGSPPSNLVYTSAPCAPSPCSRGPSLPRGRQDTCRTPPSCATPPSCGPCGTPRPGSLGCGSPGVRPLGHGVCGFPAQSYGSGFCRPSCSPSRVTQAACYRPAWGSHRR